MSMSVMFSFIEDSFSPLPKNLLDLFFWFVTLDEVIFFLFILIAMETANFHLAFSLFIVVALILVFFLRHGRAVQQKLAAVVFPG